MVTILDTTLAYVSFRDRLPSSSERGDVVHVIGHQMIAEKEHVEINYIMNGLSRLVLWRNISAHDTTVKQFQKNGKCWQTSLGMPLIFACETLNLTPRELSI